MNSTPSSQVSGTAGTYDASDYVTTVALEEWMSTKAAAILLSQTRPLISDDVFWWIRLVGFGIVSQILAIFGCVTNVINMVVFAKMGFDESINVSFLCLAVSDFASCFFITLFNLFKTPGFYDNEGLPFLQKNIEHLLVGVPKAMFTRITYCSTTFIALQRCLCIVYPFKMKLLFTRTVVSAITAVIFVAMCVLFAPIFAFQRYEVRFVPSRNASLLVISPTQAFHSFRSIWLPVATIGLPLGTSLVTAVSTAILSLKLKAAARWRNTMRLPHEVDSWSLAQASNHVIRFDQRQLMNKEMKIVKMVVLISTLFIVATIPMNALVVATLLVPELMFGGAYKNTFDTVTALAVIMEAFNASLNIFIYMNMSSKYRSIARVVFGCGK